MNDYISRQAAIDALDGLCDIVCQYSKKQRSVMCGACPLGSAFDTIEELPSADAVEVAQGKLEKAKELILSNLHNGEVCAAEIYEMAENEGISRSTTKSARRALNMIPVREKKFQGSLYWVKEGQT